MSGEPSTLLEIAGPEAFRRAFDVSRETLEKIQLYADLLRQWQKAVNLVAPRTLDTLWHRHMADSAQLARLVPDAARRLVDLGSGAGFPGLVLALMLAERPHPVAVTLIESDQRKGAFLREVARRTGVAVEILSIRIEKLETQINLPLPEVVTARALAPLDRLLDLARPLFADETLGLFPKGRDVEAEVTAARVRWRFEISLVPSLTDPEARIALVRRPRRAGGENGGETPCLD